MCVEELLVNDVWRYKRLPHSSIKRKSKREKAERKVRGGWGGGEKHRGDAAGWLKVMSTQMAPFFWVRVHLCESEWVGDGGGHDQLELRKHHTSHVTRHK